MSDGIAILNNLAVGNSLECFAEKYLFPFEFETRYRLKVWEHDA